MDLSKSSIICSAGSFCHKQHFMERFQDSVKTFYVVDASDFVAIWRHHQKMVFNKCAWGSCPYEIDYWLHSQLKRLTDFVEYVRDYNLNNEQVILKLAFFYSPKLINKHEVFWWYSLSEWEYKDVPKGKDIRWRAQCM